MTLMMRPYLREIFRHPLQDSLVRASYDDYLFRSSAHRGYRINSAIGALSAYTQQRLEQVEYPSKAVKDHFGQLLRKYGAVSPYAKSSQLKYINAFDLMRLFSEEAADNVHFLKTIHEHFGVQPSSSLAGEVLLGMVVKGVCELI
eukprot:gene29126-35154_t